MNDLAHVRPRIHAERVIFRLERGTAEIRACIQHTSVGRRFAMAVLFRGRTGPVIWMSVDKAIDLARAIERENDRGTR